MWLNFKCICLFAHRTVQHDPAQTRGHTNCWYNFLFYELCWGAYFMIWVVNVNCPDRRDSCRDQQTSLLHTKSLMHHPRSNPPLSPRPPHPLALSPSFTLYVCLSFRPKSLVIYCADSQLASKGVSMLLLYCFRLIKYLMLSLLIRWQFWRTAREGMHCILQHILLNTYGCSCCKNRYLNRNMFLRRNFKYSRTPSIEIDFDSVKFSFMRNQLVPYCYFITYHRTLKLIRDVNLSGNMCSSL